MSPVSSPVRVCIRWVSQDSIVLLGENIDITCIICTIARLGKLLYGIVIPPSEVSVLFLLFFYFFITYA